MQSSIAQSDYLKPIRKYFQIEPAPRKPGKWLISCEKCGDQWHLDKDSKAVGNVLHLLNHARGHQAADQSRSRRKQAALNALNGK